MSKYTEMIELFKVYEKILHPDFFLPIMAKMAEYQEEVKQQVISNYFNDEELKLIEDIRDYRKRKKNPNSGINPSFYLKKIIKKINEP